MKNFLIVSLLTCLVTLAAPAQEKMVPILELKVGGLLGGVQNGKFVNAETAYRKIDKDSRYTLFGLSPGAEDGELRAVINEPDVPCEDFYYAKVSPEINSGIAVGDGAGWNIVPRPAQKISLTDKTYLKIVADILRSKGLPKAKARLEQAYRVDLEGDGVDEVILKASSYAKNISPSARAGDYAFVLLRKMIGGKVQNILIAEEFIKKNIEFGAPGEYEISAVADLNGDGIMEIVIYGEYYEGSSAGVYEMKNNRPVEVKELAAGCGV